MKSEVWSIRVFSDHSFFGGGVYIEKIKMVNVRVFFLQINKMETENSACFYIFCSGTER